MQNQRVGGLGGRVPSLCEVFGEVSCQKPKSMRRWVPAARPISMAFAASTDKKKDCRVTTQKSQCNNKSVTISTQQPKHGGKLA